MIEGQAAPRRLKSSTAVLQICSMLQICSVSQSISQSVSQSVSRESLLLECEPSFFFLPPHKIKNGFSGLPSAHGAWPADVERRPHPF